MLEFNFNFGNRGGLAHIYAISPSAVRAITKNFRTGMWQMSLWKYPEEHGAFIIHIPVRSEQKIFNEECINDDNGVYYSVSIGGKIPSCRSEDAEILHILENFRWLVATKDNNGEWRLHGTISNPLIFRSTKTSADAVVRLNAITFNFTGQTDTESLYLELCDLDSL